MRNQNKDQLNITSEARRKLPRMSLRGTLARTALALAFIASEATPAAASPEKVDKQKQSIVFHLKKLANVKASKDPAEKQHLRELDGDMANIIVRAGATIYKEKDGKLVKAKTGLDKQVLHATYSDNGWRLAYFRDEGKKPMAIPLDESNQDLIQKVTYDSNGDRHVDPYRVNDHITTSTVSVDYVENGYAFTKHISPQDLLNGTVSEELPVPYVAIAQATSAKSVTAHQRM